MPLRGGMPDILTGSEAGPSKTSSKQVISRVTLSDFIYRRIAPSKVLILNSDTSLLILQASS